MKKILKLSSCVLAATILASCSSSVNTSGSLNLEDTEEETTSSISSSSENVEEEKKPTVSQVDSGIATLTVPDEVKNVNDQKKLDTYFFTIVKKSGVPDSEQNLRQLRREVCQSVAKDPSLESVSQLLSSRRYTEEQIGIIIAGSMISQCNDTHANIKKEDLKKPSEASQEIQPKDNQGEK